MAKKKTPAKKAPKKHMYCPECGKKIERASAFCKECGHSLKGIKQKESGIRYAGFWIRFAANIIDSLILLAITFAIGFGFGFALGGLFYYTEGFGTAAIIVNIISIAIGVAYYIYFHGKYGATLGKQLVDVKVVYESGKPFGYKGAAIRYLGRIVCSLTFGIGFIIIGFTKKKQGIHDMIAKTIVVHTD